MSANPCLIFDLDGTLVDSIPDLTDSLNRTLARRNLAPLASRQLVAMVGDGAQALLSRAFAAHGLPPDAKALEDFLADYQSRATDRSVPYPGVATTLQRLFDSGYVMGVCTNKPEAPARQVLRELGLAHFFRAVAGGDSTPSRKPDPGHLLAVIAAAGSVPAQAVMIGDHANDVQAALGAGVPAIFAAWGYGSPEMAAGAVATVQEFAEVPGAVEKLFAAT